MTMDQGRTMGTEEGKLEIRNDKKVVEREKDGRNN
jgi:hypothetical protein